VPAKDSVTKAKVYYKTRGVKASGSCGHEYTTRISLGMHAGNPVNAKSDKQINAIVRETRKYMKSNICSKCTAEQILSEVRESDKGILESLGLPLFPTMSGGVGQQAWAERTRNEHLRYLLFGGISPNLAPTVLEFILSTRASDKVKSQKLKAEIQKSRQVKSHIAEVGYLGRLYYQEMEAGSERTLLRRLLISRALIRNNMRLFEETRHTFWIMYEKRGNTAFNTRFAPLSQTEFLAISYVVNEDLESVEEYEKAIEILSKKAYASDREILKSLPPEQTVLEKAELMQVYNSLTETPEKDLPF
jgi:hypothetical protein